jgi:hypothetical protein
VAVVVAAAPELAEAVEAAEDAEPAEVAAAGSVAADVADVAAAASDGSACQWHAQGAVHRGAAAGIARSQHSLTQ